MAQPTISIPLNDVNVALHGVEQLCLILLVLIIAAALLRKKDFIAPNLKNIFLLLVGLWAIALVLQYAISVKNYMSYLRPIQKQSNSQVTGL